jgi:hypothetical protein
LLSATPRKYEGFHAQDRPFHRIFVLVASDQSHLTMKYGGLLVR